MQKMMPSVLVCSCGKLAMMLLACILGLFSYAHAVTEDMRCPGDYVAWMEGKLCGGKGPPPYWYPHTFRTEQHDTATGSTLTYFAMCPGDPEFDHEPYEYLFCIEQYPIDIVPKGPPPTVNPPVNQCGSIIHADHMAVGESVPVPGTPFSLVYFSDRVPGRVAEYTVKYALAGGFHAPTFSQAELAIANYRTRTELVVNGTTTVHEVPASVTPVMASFIWDGTDAQGRLVPGSVPVTIKRRDVLCDPPEGTSCTEDHPLEFTVILGTWNLLREGLGGWNLSPHHYYDRTRTQLYLGDGTSRMVKATRTATGYRVASEDGTEVYLFTANGRHTQTLHGLTGQTLLTFTYNARGLLAALTDADGNRTTIVRNASGQATGIRSPYGQITTLTMDADGLLRTIQTPNNETYQMTYWSAAGLLKTFRTPRGLESTFTYDAEGHLVQDANNAAFAWHLAATAPTATVRSITLTSAAGRTSQYDVRIPAAGAVERTVTDALGIQTTYAADPTARDLTGPTGTFHSDLTPDPRFGAQAPYASASVLDTPEGLHWTRNVTQAVTLADPANPFSVDTLTMRHTTNGNRATLVYDGATRTSTVTTPERRKAVVTIDDTGRVTAEQLGTRTPVQYTYDTRGRLAQVTQGARTTALTYNSSGWVDTVTNPLGQTTTFQYDDAGRVTLQTLPDGREMALAYDADGNLTGLTPPGRAQHRLARRLQGDLSAYRPPALGDGAPVQTTYTYNRDRQLTSVRRPDGQVIRLTYGADTGALDTITTPQGTRTVRWDPSNGLVQAVSSPDGTVTRAYDGTLLTLEQSSNRLVQWTYNNDLRVASQTVTDGAGKRSQVAYTYDRDGWPTAVGALALAWNRNRWVPASTTLGAVTHRFTTNALGELTRTQATYQGTGLYDMALTRDALGRVKTKTETLEGVTTTSRYIYDSSGRLKTVTTNGALAERYTYDANSNRTARTVQGATVTATTDAQDRVLTQGTLRFTYTPNGELLTKTDSATRKTTTYTYDVLGNLTHVRLPTGARIEYVIDGFNRRVGKKVNDALVRQYIYQSPLQLVAELNPQGRLVARFVYGTRAHVPDYMEKNGATYRFITDHLGSVRLVVHAQTGAIAQRLDYDTFGRVLRDTNPGFQPFGFAGGLYEPATQLVRFGARDYDPETGRWTSKDPILFDGGDTNLYGYVLNDPINLMDPSGKSLQNLKTIGYLLLMLFNINNFSPPPPELPSGGPPTIQMPRTPLSPIVNPGEPEPLPEQPNSCPASPESRGSRGPGSGGQPPVDPPKPPVVTPSWWQQILGKFPSSGPWIIIPNVCIYPGMCDDGKDVY